MVGFVRCLRSQDELREVGGQYHYVSTVAGYTSFILIGRSFTYKFFLEMRHTAFLEMRDRIGLRDECNMQTNNVNGCQVRRGRHLQRKLAACLIWRLSDGAVDRLHPASSRSW